MKFAGCNHYQEQIKQLHFARDWNRIKGAEYDRIFESTSIGVKQVLTSIANEFTNFTAQTNTDAIEYTSKILR